MMTFDEWFEEAGIDASFKGVAHVAWLAGFYAGLTPEAATLIHEGRCAMCGDPKSVCPCPTNEPQLTK